MGCLGTRANQLRVSLDCDLIGVFAVISERNYAAISTPMSTVSTPSRFWPTSWQPQTFRTIIPCAIFLICSGDPDGTFKRAFDVLVNETNHYDWNTVNAKIVSPDDDNYSDDELTFLPYYTMFTAGGHANPLFVASLRRTWSLCRGIRSDLWNTIYAAMGAGLLRLYLHLVCNCDLYHINYLM
jgi:hypothetical protein